MEAQLKQRVIGAAVLVSLAVIFIPILLDDGSSDTPQPQVIDSEIEPPEAFSSRVVPIDDATMDELETAMEASPEALAAEKNWTEAVIPNVEPTPSATSTPPTQEMEAAVATPPAAPVSTNEPPASSIAPKPDVSPKPEVDSKRKSKPAAPKPSLTSRVPNDDVAAWVVQLGSFKSEKNATALVESLKKDSFTAFIEPLGESPDKRFRVRVGPELSRLTAERIRDELAKKVKIKGILMRYP